MRWLKNQGRRIINRRAFLLVELLVLFLIVAFLGVATVPTFTRIVHERAVQHEAYVMATRIRAAWYRARMSGSSHEVIFYPQKQVYVCDGDEHVLSPGVRFGSVSNALGPPAVPSKVIRTPVTFPDNHLILTAQGILSSGTVYLTDDARQVGYALTIPVGSSVVITMYQYASSRWHRQ